MLNCTTPHWPKPDLLEHSNDARLIDVDAYEADLRATYFRNAYLAQSRFRRADLRMANFRGARMIHVYLTSADVRGADFRRADLRLAVLTDVCFDAGTRWGSNSPPTSSSC